MKGFVFFVLAGLIMLMSLSIVNAVGCSNNNQIIMRLSSSSNAHGALWNQSYTERVCYDEIFGTYTGNNPHDDCSSGKAVLRLASSNNSHAAIPSDTSYPFQVCHKGLSGCDISPGTTCPAGKSPIVYLSALNNAHISKTPLSGYLPVCCSGTGTPPVIPPTSITHCSNYTSQNTCSSDSQNVAGNACPTGQSCSCNWNGTKCNQEYTSQQGDCRYRCTVSLISQTECREDGTQEITVKGSITPISSTTSCAGVSDNACTIQKTSVVPCGEIGLDLPFFGIWQFMISAMMITAYYAVSRRRINKS